MTATHPVARPFGPIAADATLDPVAGPSPGAARVTPGVQRASATTGAPLLSILVPTRNEAANVEPLVARIEHSTRDLAAELVFVDDSDDDTPDRIALMAQRSTLPLTLVARPRGERDGGLGGAVKTGCGVASGRWICVMDGDLQHPPELIPELLAKAESGGADLVLASRLSRDDGLGELGPGRRLISKALALLTRALFLEQLAGVTDPMTGFFLVRREAIELERLRPDGFKILLEILVSNPGLVVHEVPFRFDSRQAERSKAGVREVFRLGRTMARLSLRANRRLARFFAVGASGFVVNNALMAALVEGLGLHYLASAALATLGTTFWNFSFTELWVFRDRNHQGERSRRMGAYLALSGAGLLARSPLLYLLTTVIGLHYLASNVLSIVALTGIRYALSTRWIWRPLSPGRRAAIDRGQLREPRRPRRQRHG
jgi:glycosyltransferase involved in cell wall biosynthesis